MNRLPTYLLFFLGALVLAQGCIPPSDEVKTEISLDARSPVFQRVVDFQDRKEADSLYVFFRDEDPSWRYLAARAFASIRDGSGIDSLQRLLRDPVVRVRAAAAYAIGQTGDERGARPLLQAFERTDTAGVFAFSNAAILEAVGKCGGEEELKALATISTYQATDTLLLLGQARGVYQFALRGKVAPEGTARMLQLACSKVYPTEVRLQAAHYLQRAPGIDLTGAGGQLSGAIAQEPEADVRMALATALGKTLSEEALPALLKLRGSDPDYRVRCNVLAAYANYPYDSVQLDVQRALSSAQEQEAVRAAGYFLENGIARDASSYWQWAKDSLPAMVQLGLYRAANRHLPAYAVNTRDAINAELRQWLQGTASVYEKAAALRALAEFGWNFRYIYQQGAQSSSPVVRTATMEALAAISGRADFRAFFGSGYRSVRRELLGMYLEVLQAGDPGMIAVAAVALRNENLNFDALISNLDIPQQALARLELPKEIETYNELAHTIAFLKGEGRPQPRKPVYNHPIDWAMLNGLNPAREVVLETNKGNISLEMLPGFAPGTVANFIGLARQGFYNEKTFHRVVPNFVVQGGCPRGDGYGSLDYSIRSELPELHYDAQGYVGMASAGNDTECTQFFITHSPTPHLDGEYTIFARVTAGMDIVHELQIGDRINKVALAK